METERNTRPSEVEICDLRLDALKSVSAIHLASFPDSAISKLGMESIRRYYEWQLVGPHRCDAIGAYQNSELIGFLFGGHFNGALSGFLNKNRWYLAWRIAIHPNVVFDSSFRQKLLQGVRSLSRWKKKRTAAPLQGQVCTSSFGILAIAVSPDCQGHGVGKLLMTEAERRAEHSGHDGMHLTVSPQNGQAVRFYEGIGWHKNPNDESWQGGMRKEIGGSNVAGELFVHAAEN